MSKQVNKIDKLSALNKEIDEWRNKYLRALADYENLEKRTQTIIDNAKLKFSKELLSNFLEIMDNIESAEMFIQDKGLKLIAEKFRNTLRQMGVSEIEIVGKPFDPYVAEVVEVVPGDRNDYVSEITQKGYTINGNVIRPARVKVIRTGN